MDSLTQLALGATIAATVLGARVGPRKAVLVGAALGTACASLVYRLLTDRAAGERDVAAPCCAGRGSALRPRV